MKMRGFLGEITFKGDLEKFLPFIMLGEYIHVGKGTSFGLGKYEINTCYDNDLQLPDCFFSKQMFGR